MSRAGDEAVKAMSFQMGEFAIKKSPVSEMHSTKSTTQCLYLQRGSVQIVQAMTAAEIERDSESALGQKSSIQFEFDDDQVELRSLPQTSPKKGVQCSHSFWSKGRA